MCRSNRIYGRRKYQSILPADFIGRFYFSGRGKPYTANRSRNFPGIEQPDIQRKIGLGAGKAATSLSDPLARFRQEQAAAVNQPRTGKKPYEAYDKSGKPCPYTEILSVSQPSHYQQARFLLDAIFSAGFDDAITLLYSFMTVEIKGRHLKEVWQAVHNGRCGFLQEYDENEFLPPAKNAPVIESIHFIAGKKPDNILYWRMFDDTFPFTKLIEIFFDFIEKSGFDKMAGLPQGAKIKIPSDIVISLLRPDELEKLRNYVTVRLAKHNSNENVQ